MAKSKLSSLLDSGWQFSDIEDSLDEHSLMLLYLSRHSQMPELYNELGKEGFLRLVQAFGGTRLELPTQEELIRAVTEVHIYSELKDKPSDRRIADRLARKYQCARSDIRDIFLRVQEEFESMGRDLKMVLVKRREQDEREAAEEIQMLNDLFDGSEIDG